MNIQEDGGVSTQLYQSAKKESFQKAEYMAKKYGSFQSNCFKFVARERSLWQLRLGE
ncbi:hypothetical protein P4544_17270 [Halomonas sp. LY9]